MSGCVSVSRRIRAPSLGPQSGLGDGRRAPRPWRSGVGRGCRASRTSWRAGPGRPGRRTPARRVGDQAQGRVPAQGEGLERQVEVADDGVVQQLDPGGVDADVMRGPAAAGSPRCGWTAARPGPRGHGRGDRGRPRHAGSRRCRWRRCPSHGRRSWPAGRGRRTAHCSARSPRSSSRPGREERAAERVGGDDVEAPVEDDRGRRRSSSRGGAAPSDGPATAVGVRRRRARVGVPAVLSRSSRWARSASVESQGPGDPVDDALGDAGRGAALEADVVLRRDARPGARPPRVAGRAPGGGPRRTTGVRPARG